MNSSKPKVSVITVTYNAHDFILQTMESVFSQTYHDVEYIIVDGGSTDGTVELISQHQDRLSQWVSEKDNGVYDAMNKGIGMAHGALIGIVNASDYLEPDTVQRVVEAYCLHPECGIFHGNVNMLNEDGSFFKMKRPVEDPARLAKGMSMFHPTFFVVSSVYRQVGLFDEQFRVAADYDFALRCYRAGVRFCYLDVVLSNFRRGGLSSSQKRMAMSESKAVLIKNGYSADYAELTYREWVSAHRKDMCYQWGYRCLKKILPASVLRRLASRVSVRH